MNDSVRRTLLGFVVLAAYAPGGVRAQFRDPLDLDEISLSGRTPESIILLWPAFSYRLARMMISKYGQPAQATDHSLIWRDNAPWKRIVVYRTPAKEGLFKRNRGRLEQSVAYRVPQGKLDALALFDREIEADAKEGLLTARTDDEGSNFLALNLADEVLQGLRTPEDAKAFRLKAARLRESGKVSPYFDGLLFYPGGRPANPERPN